MVAPRVRKKCPHGRERNRCKECGGKGICPHGRQRNKCKECGGKSICPHGRQRNNCIPCGGKSICEHGRQRNKCKECGGKGVCPHGRQRNTCKECGGKGICPHGRRRNECKECGGKSICPHGRQRNMCIPCGGKYICPHGRRRNECGECGGKGICHTEGCTNVAQSPGHRCARCGGGRRCSCGCYAPFRLTEEGAARLRRLRRRGPAGGGEASATHGCLGCLLVIDNHSGLFSPRHTTVHVDRRGWVSHLATRYTTSTAEGATLGLDRTQRKALDRSHFREVTLVNRADGAYRIPAGSYEVQNTPPLLGDTGEAVEIKVGTERVVFRNPWGNQNDRLRRFRVSKEIFVLAELERGLIGEGFAGNISGHPWLEVIQDSARRRAAGSDEPRAAQWDTGVSGWGCGGIRPDYVIYVGDYALILEVDEHQHSDQVAYPQHREIARLQQIYWEMLEKDGVRAVGFLRFNPDECQGRPTSMFDTSRDSQGDKRCRSREPEFGERMTVLAGAVNRMVAERRDRALEFLYYDEECHYNVDFSLNPGPSAQPRRSQWGDTAQGGLDTLFDDGGISAYLPP